MANSKSLRSKHAMLHSARCCLPRAAQDPACSCHPARMHMEHAVTAAASQARAAAAHPQGVSGTPLLG